MPTKKLKALALVASDEDKAVINEVIAMRDSHAEKGENGVHTYIEKPSELSPEEQAIIDAAEAEANGTAPAPKKALRMSNAERDELAESLKINVGHRCKVVPFNTIIWEDGTIVGVISDKRTNKVLFSVRLDSGRRIVKASDSSMLQILEETVEITKRNANTGATKSTEKPTEEELAKVVIDNLHLIGHYASYEPFKKSVPAVPLEGVEAIEAEVAPAVVSRIRGIIVALIPDKRSGKVLLRIETAAEDKKIIAHKGIGAPDLVIEDECNEDVASKAAKRREISATRAKLSPAEKVEVAKKNLEKAEKEYARFAELIELRKKDLEKVLAEFGDKILEQAPAEAQVEDAADLM